MKLKKQIFANFNELKINNFLKNEIRKTNFCQFYSILQIVD